jgi:hypothetical protein
MKTFEAVAPVALHDHERALFHMRGRVRQGNSTVWNGTTTAP